MQDRYAWVLIFFACSFLIFVLILGGTFYAIYRKNKVNLEAQKAGVKIKPSIYRFLLAWYLYLLFFLVPLLLIVWFIPEIGKRAVLASLVFVPIMWLCFAMTAYPYYVLVADERRLNGATLSGMFWKRTDINIDEIDTENVLRQGLGRKLGIVIFRSTNGKKILSLGLQDVQVMNILTSTKKQIHDG